MSTVDVNVDLIGRALVERGGVESAPGPEEVLIDPSPRAPGERAWMARAACLGAEPEIFFPVGPTGPGLAAASEAKAICEQCTVRERCLAYALTNGCTDGIWGGLTERERRALRRKSVLDRPAGGSRPR